MVDIQPAATILVRSCSIQPERRGPVWMMMLLSLFRWHKCCKAKWIEQPIFCFMRPSHKPRFESHTTRLCMNVVYVLYKASWPQCYIAEFVYRLGSLPEFYPSSVRWFTPNFARSRSGSWHTCCEGEPRYSSAEPSLQEANRERAGTTGTREISPISWHTSPSLQESSSQLCKSRKNRRPRSNRKT